ncbi:hypothetical protein REPUB_Repub11eG0116400 [Reevesia pubescens]
MQDFCSALKTCDLYDVQVQGPMFTWTRKQENEMVYKQLDRVVVTSQWWDVYPTTTKEHLMAKTSYHLPILVQFGKAINLSHP